MPTGIHGSGSHRKFSFAQVLSLAALVIGASLSPSPARGTPSAGGEGGPESAGDQETVVRLALPSDVSREAVLSGREAVKQRLFAYVKERVGARSEAGERNAHEDSVVVFLDRDGSPILPDLEAARTRAHPRAESLATETELTFTFNSPLYPWTAADLQALDDQIDDFYPAIRSLFGDPGFSITVNIRQDLSPTAGNWYFPSLNEIVLSRGWSMGGEDILCHEIVHAFRDDALIWVNSYEEGMARAVEVEILNRHSGKYDYWDFHHGYPYDMFYENLNTQSNGPWRGQFFDMDMIYYQLGGYAWGKVFLENPGFFADFNADYYARLLSDPGCNGDEARLFDLARGCADTVEGMPFARWYKRQGILNVEPPIGYYIVHTQYQQYGHACLLYRSYTADFSEHRRVQATFQWSAFDENDSVIGGGMFVSTPTSCGEYGAPPDGWGRAGRIKYVLTATGPDGVAVTDSFYEPGANEFGVFGVVPHANTGTLTLTPLDDPTPAASVPVVSGAFFAPSLAAAKGPFFAQFTDAAGHSFSRYFTKDASDYFLLMAEADLSTTLSDSIDPAPLGSELVYTAVVRNAGPSSGTGAILRLYVPPELTYVPTAPGQGMCGWTPSRSPGPGGLLVCALGSLPAGGQAGASLRVRSTSMGTVSVRASVIGTEWDSIGAGDEAVQATTIGPAHTANFVGNPGFETGLAGWTPADSGTKLDRVGTAHSGSYAARIRRARTTGEAQLNDHPNWQSRTTAGTTCTASAWVKGVKGSEVRIRLREYRGDTRVAYASEGITLKDTAWHEITVSLRAASGGDSMDLNVYGKNFPVGRELLVDDISESCR